MVLCSIGIVYLFGADGQGIDGIVSHAALDTPANPPCGQANQLLFLQEIIRVLGKVVPPVDLFAGDRRGSRGQSFPLGIPGEIESHVQDVQAGTQTVIISSHLLSADVDIITHREQAFVVLLFCS